MALRIPLVTVTGTTRQVQSGDYVIASSLGSGTTDATTYLKGDNTWAVLAADLTVLSGFGAGTGFPARTGTNTWSLRTITGTASRISITNGTGVSGNPTVDIDAAYVGQTSIITLGTITTGTWNAGSVTSTTLAVSTTSTHTGFSTFGSATAAAAQIDINGNVTASAWTTSGIGLRIRGNTYTDSGTAASGTAASNHIHAIAAPTLAATNTGVITTTAATLYIGGAPVAGTNQTITTPLALQVVSGNIAFNTTSGSVGIGTLAAGKKLDVVSAGDDAIQFRTSTRTIGIGTTSGECSLYWGSSTALNFISSGISWLTVASDGRFLINTSATIAATGALNWGSSGVSTPDVALVRDAANTLAQRNGTASQTLRVYGTYTDASNYERLEIATLAGTTGITQTQAGTGVVRGLNIGCSGSAALGFVTTNSVRWLIQNDGHFRPNTDNTFDLGTSTIRPRTGFFGTNLFIGATTQSLNERLSITDSSTLTSGIGSSAYILRIDTPASASTTVSSGLQVDSIFNAGTTITGTRQFGIYTRVQSSGGTGTLTQAYGFYSEFSQSVARTTSIVSGFRTNISTISLGTVTEFNAYDSVDQASANIVTAISFRGRMASGTNRWNLYLDGTAANFLAGATTIGGGSDATTTLLVKGITRGIRIGTSASTGVIEAVDNTGVASYQPLQVGGSTIAFQTSGTTIASITSTGFLIGIGTAAASLDMATNVTAASWNAEGIGLRLRGNTYTEINTSGSITIRNHIHAIAIPTLAATNINVTTITSATLYIAGAPIAGTNMTISNPISLLVAAGQSAFAIGNAAKPSIAHAADLGTGMWFATSTINFSCAGGTQMQLVPGALYAPSIIGIGTAADCLLSRSSAATLQQGAANAAAPVAQTLQAQGSRAGTDTNIGGASYTIQSGIGTGTGAASSLIFRAPVVVAAGTGAQTMTTALTLTGTTAVFSGVLTATSAVLTTPNIGVATGTSLNVTNSLNVGDTTAPAGIGAPSGMISSNISGHDFIIRKCRNSNVEPATMSWISSRGTAAAPTTSINGDYLQNLLSYGHDGTNHVLCGAIQTVVSGPVSTGVVPGVMLFGTANISGTFTERLRLTHDGAIMATGTLSGTLISTLTTGDAYIISRTTGTIQSAIVQIIGRQASVDNEWNLVAAGNGLGVGPVLRIVRGGWTGSPAIEIQNVVDSVNYHSFSPGITGNRIKWEALGSNTNIGISINAKGTGDISLGSSLVVTGNITGTNVISITGTNAGLEIGAAAVSNTPYIDFHSSSTNNDWDFRLTASGGGATANLGYLTFNGAVASFECLVRMKSYTVATLPAAAQGDRAMVSDASSPVFGSAVAGGGAVKVPVYYTGTAWFVG